MRESKSSTSGGIGLFGALFLVLLTLKLLGKITLSWFLVTAPLWGGLAIGMGIFAIVGLIALFAWLATRRGR